MEPIDFRNILEEDYKYTVDFEENSKTRLGYLAEHLFEFFTYDSAMDDMMVMIALDICKAINERTTFQYIEKSEEHYKDYLVFLHTTFFEPRLSWGCSIRGAWWDHEPQKRGLTIPGELSIYDPKTRNPVKNLSKVVFSVDEWKLFIQAVMDFASVEYVAGSETHRNSTEEQK